MKITEQMVDAGAKAIERQYHREVGVCEKRDGGPSDCWKSMRKYSRLALRAALKAKGKL